MGWLRMVRKAAQGSHVVTTPVLGWSFQSYQAMRYVRSPLAPFSVTTSWPRRFLTMLEIAPPEDYEVREARLIQWIHEHPDSPATELLQYTHALVYGERV